MHHSAGLQACGPGGFRSVYYPESGTCITSSPTMSVNVHLSCTRDVTTRCYGQVTFDVRENIGYLSPDHNPPRFVR